MTAPVVAVFMRIFTMNTFQASLVQFAYYGAYFALALPAAFINQRFGYKTGLLTNLRRDNPAPLRLTRGKTYGRTLALS